jgi:hypothetical protein
MEGLLKLGVKLLGRADGMRANLVMVVMDDAPKFALGFRSW